MNIGICPSRSRFTRTRAAILSVVLIATTGCMSAPPLSAPAPGRGVASEPPADMSNRPPGRADGVVSEITEIAGLYVHVFGERTDPPLVFVHGGPGANSSDFEANTAESLAKLGYFVVVYDERGQGRSQQTIDGRRLLNPTAQPSPQERGFFTYRAYADDLLKVIATLRLKNVVLLAHSHGGPIAIQFDATYPNLTRAVILISAPVNVWSMMTGIFENCEARELAGDAQKQRYLPYLRSSYAKLKASDHGRPDLVDPVAVLFQQAIFVCDLYKTSRPDTDQTRLDKLAQDNRAPMEIFSMPGFLMNENYIYRNHFDVIEKRRGHFFGIYGTEDGLFTPATLEKLKSAINDVNPGDGRGERFFLIPGAAHAVYSTRQSKFLELVEQIERGLRH